MSALPLILRGSRPIREVARLASNGIWKRTLLSGRWLVRSNLVEKGCFSPQRPVIPTRYFMQKIEDGPPETQDIGKFSVTLDMSDFDPSEVTVQSSANIIHVEAHKEEFRPESSATLHFRRQFVLPNKIDPESLTYEMSTEGQLTITASMRDSSMRRQVPKSRKLMKYLYSKGRYNPAQYTEVE